MRQHMTAPDDVGMYSIDLAFDTAEFVQLMADALAKGGSTGDSGRVGRALLADFSSLRVTSDRRGVTVSALCRRR